MPEVIGQTPDLLCVFHSACLMYWSREVKAALEQLLREAGRDREIYRIGLEPSESFSSWQQGRSSGEKRLPGGKPPTGDITVTRYHNGRADTRMVAHNNRSDYGSVQWLD